ncbi:hypothetical protein KFK09_016995 [Dendrobium nobile]|uniref:ROTUNDIFOLIA like 8 n=2 Tax=Dendrobium TaxID=37818 RepID=A0A8T3B128_DENNO|nr:hypothetical protein KFK09_016995 [Dendrobium nobile]PKU76064.1 hypothetical protein MA16_Dca011432 [Dendrobium catenatum]
MELYVEKKWKLVKKGSKKETTMASDSDKKESAAARRSFTRRCTRLAKEQRARFYIMRRCVTMLVCWRD